ncbi:MAG: hypothetical protein ABI832_20260 [bacterium]
MLALIEARMIASFRDIGTVELWAQPDFALIGAAIERHGIAMAARAVASWPGSVA